METSRRRLGGGGAYIERGVCSGMRLILIREGFSISG